MGGLTAARGRLGLLGLGITLLVIAAMWCGCGGAAGPAGTGANRAPVISSLVSTPSGTVAGGAACTITATATDADGDTLTYAWTQTGGAVTGSGSQVTWTAPATAGDYQVTCAVSDGTADAVQAVLQFTVATGDLDVSLD